jgi:cell division protein FtsI/penicillin-binding protein 2
LATTVPVKTVCANPLRVGDRRRELARLLAPILDIPEEHLVKRMEPRKIVNPQGEVRDVKYVVLKRKVALEDWDRIQAAIRGLGLEWETIFTEPVDGERRLYPNGSLAAHVLGFTGISDEPVSRALAETLVGKSGVEASLNAVLSGTQGWRQMLWDAERKNELVAMRLLDIPPRAGLGVVLTLDAGIQHIVESEIEAAFLQHAPISITCLVVRPQTGEILAMANLPTFDPNRPGDVPPGNLRNRAIADVAEPGSTFKALVVAGALNDGVVSLDTEFHCENGYFVFKRQPLRDVHAYGVLRVEDIIAKSSNIGAAKIGIQLGESRLYHYVRAFGMGEPTRLPLGGEVSGLFEPPKNWSKITVAWIPMGHEVATTPLQMAMAMSAIANGGRLMRPMLVSALVDEEGRTLAQMEPALVREVISEKAARQMTQALRTAVDSGTGKKARLDFYEVAGKTGTAQKLIGGRYSKQRHFVSFIGYFPADAPELCISVVIDDPKKGTYGGETAAPVWKRIAERASAYLGIPPSQGFEAPLLTGPAAGRGKS